MRSLLDDHECHGVVPAVTDADVALPAGLTEPLRGPYEREGGRVPGFPHDLDIGDQPLGLFFSDPGRDACGFLGGVAASKVRTRITARETVATLGLREEGARGGRRFLELRHEDSDAHRRMVDGLQTAGKR